MPKRTNDFQELIKTIYEQIVPEGGKVTESGMVHDKEAGILREVDILVEYKYAGHNFRFIVECRDRARPETIEWIDGLIGKAKSLNVDKIIAVSSNGFTHSAKNKATENGIETLTLEAAKKIDWSNFPIKPGLIVFSDDTYHIHDVLLKDGEDYIPITTLGLENRVEINGKEAGTLDGLIKYFFQNILAPKIDEHKKNHFLEIFKTKGDIEKILVSESEHNWRNIYVVDDRERKTELKTIKYIVHGQRKTTDIEQEHQVFNQKMVSTGIHLDTDGSTINFNIVQDPDTRKTHFRWRRKKQLDIKSSATSPQSAPDTYHHDPCTKSRTLHHR